MIKLKSNLLEKKLIEDFERLWESPFSGNRGLHKFECYCLYSFIRTYKPVKIVEMSPDEGFSTFVMLSAILDEGYKIDFFKSYDLQNKLKRETLEKIQNFPSFSFFEGDASQIISFNEDHIDFFFIDSLGTFTFEEA